MRCEDVIELYQALDELGVAIWIDGGWAVDAVLGRETRPHQDLDIAVEAKFLPALRCFLAERGYSQAPSMDASPWNFVLEDGEGRCVDVHVVVLDERLGVCADVLGGIAYPAGSLTGVGVLSGVSVRCVRPESLLQFKLSYPPRAIDRHDVAVLCEALGVPTPDTHQ